MKDKINMQLKKMLGPDAKFRDGQYEAIESTLVKKRTLIVQKTGWGKSLVYFICTSINREEGKGVTFVVSPLLSLMKNQSDMASRLRLRTKILNSTTKDEWDEIIQLLLQNKLDVVFITPETLFNKKIQKVIFDINIGLFVIDEAHCISDWGHDFRLEYSKLKDVISRFPSNVSILATTATANNRVVEDLKLQLGEDIYISRGNLMRNNLYIQVLKMPDKESKLGWILENIDDFNGNGIIYCLTKGDCDLVYNFLLENSIDVRPYHGGLNEETNEVNLKLFTENKIKALVATVKLGMGFDKGDISFVIHFQSPQNIVSYYQQIGRAGRNINSALTFLMQGPEDKKIVNSFINFAFPSANEMNNIYELISSNNGTKTSEIDSHLNIRKSRKDKCLDFLEKDGYIYKENYKYFATPKQYRYNEEHYESIKKIRRKELEEIQELPNVQACYNWHIVSLLDDKTQDKCSFCANCNKELFPTEVKREYIEKASNYINNLTLKIIPRKRWIHNWKSIDMPNEIGLCLCKYGDGKYGELVKAGKYITNRFSDVLLDRSVEVIRNQILNNNNNNDIAYITNVPSLRSKIVDDFTSRLAVKLGLEFLEIMQKFDAEQQKIMENSYYQFKNANESFDVNNFDYDVFKNKSIILVDDVVDSKWTITICGYKLREIGFKSVFPFALADSSNNGDL